MTALLTSIFGASWRTTVVGLLQLAIGTGLNYYQSLAPGATFDTHVLIVQIGIALLAFFTKDGQVHGGTIPTGTTPTPEATAQAVAAVQAKQ